jgi:cell division protein FtsB
MNELEKLKKENNSLKETCEILANGEAIYDIKNSLKEISRGDYISIDKL